MVTSRWRNSSYCRIWTINVRGAYDYFWDGNGPTNGLQQLPANIFEKYRVVRYRVLEEPKRHGEIIREAGGMSLLGDISISSDRGTGPPKDFLFAFCTNWQLNLIRQYSSLLCLEFTHNTCCALVSKRKVFLHSIVIKNEDLVCGLPVTFIITRTGSIFSLGEWLGWVNNAMPFKRLPIFIIGCWKTEVAAIRSASKDPGAWCGLEQLVNSENFGLLTSLDTLIILHE